MSSLLFPLLNVSILLGLMVYYLRSPLKEMVLTRQTTIRSEVEGARKRLQESQRRFEELSAKIRGVDAELAGIKAQGVREASDTKARILQESKKLALTIAADAHSAAEAARSDFKLSLVAEIGAKVLGRAEELLRERLTGDDKARLTHEFSREVGGIR